MPDNRESSFIDVDADVARESKQTRLRALNVVRVPALRLVGFALVLLFVLLYTYFVTGSVDWASLGVFAAAVLVYCWLSWVALSVWYEPDSRFDLGLVFLAADMGIWTVAIALCGGSSTGLLFLLVVRAADQALTGFRRAIFFAHLGVVCAAGLLAYEYTAHGVVPNAPAELVKLVVLYGASLYVAATARAAEQSRDRTRAAMHLARDLIATLERKERELVESERRFRDLFEHVPVGLFRSAPDGTIDLANPALLRMLGYAALDELADRKLDQPESSVSREELRARLEREGEIRGLEAIWARRDGTRIYVSENTRAVRDGRGRVAAYEGSVEDVSTRKEAELAMRDAKDAAEAAARAKSEFLGNMSHEIRTPMNAIVGMTSLMLRTELSGEQREYAETVRQAGDALLAIVNDVLDFSKIETGRLDLELRPFDLRACVEDCLDLVAAQAAGKRIELVYEVDADTPHALVGDAARLRQILANLLSNAVKFTASGEVSVRVDARSLADRARVVRFAVRDTGIGIPEDRLATLFDSFTQVDGSTTRKFGGTGLGLAISKRLAELMGGIMWVESREGEGSTFSFTVMADAAEAPAPEHLSPARGEIAGRRLLVVDGNATRARALAALGRTWGAEVVAATTAAAAIGVLGRGEPFDVALVDEAVDGVDVGALAAREARVVRLATRGAGPPPAASVAKPVRVAALHAAVLEALARRAGADGASAAFAPPLRVLLVEDNMVNQRVAIRMLAKLGYASDLAVDGVEAIEAVTRVRYDVVFMDVQMPEMDGLTATRWIRHAIPPAEQPRIIALTAYGAGDDRVACEAAGMDDYVGKPVKIEDLAAAMQRATAALR